MSETERIVWLAGYVFLVFAPIGFVAVADVSTQLSFGVVLAAGLGFSGLVMLCLQLLMPSRAPSFTSPFGIDVILRFHRQIGYVALIVVVGHIVVLMIDDPGRLALLNFTAAPWRAQAATAAIGALALLIITSVKRDQLGLRYEHWRALHLGLGVGVVGFSCLHALGVARYLSVRPLLWATLLLVILAAVGLLYLRIGRPLASAARPYRLKRVRHERGGAATLELEADRHPGVAFSPGQFAWIKPAASPWSLIEHPFSFSSSALFTREPEFTVKAVGDFSARVADLSPGEMLLIDGPHGSFELRDGDRGYLMIAGGIGITPMVSLLRTLADQGDRRPATLIYACKTWDSVTFREELEELEADLDLSVVHVLSRPHEGWSGERGRIDAEMLGRILPLRALTWRALICGPAGMTEKAVSALQEFGFPPGSLHAERFDSV